GSGCCHQARPASNRAATSSGRLRDRAVRRVFGMRCSMRPRAWCFREACTPRSRALHAGARTGGRRRRWNAAVPCRTLVGRAGIPTLCRPPGCSGHAILKETTMAYTLPELPYAYDALEPHIDTETTMIHHTKQLKTYNNYVIATLEVTA